MTKRAAFSLTVSALMLGGTMVGCTTQHHGIAAATDAAQARAAKLAAASADEARAAMAKHKGAAAVTAAENAVRWQPQNAAYRALLGQSYMTAGRFASARDALTDALTLSPNDARIALNLALAQTAAGNWDAARKTLDSHAEQIPVADRGLAMALAGDPQTAVSILTDAARQPGADAKTRQNLALALALCGRWQEAKAVASMDLGADQIDRRMEEWAAFAYPKSAAQQVATLLGVTPVADQGQPTALALTAPVATVAQAEPAVPTTDVPPSAPAAETPAPAQVATAAPAPVTAPPAAAPVPAVANAVAASAMPVAPAARVAKVARVSAKPVPVVAKPTKGEYFVQLGAYENAAVAHDGWLRATRRYPAFADHQPQGMSVKTSAATFYRLSVGGFSRADANAMCRTYRAKGGRCFVRVGAGDQVAQWVQAKRQLAMR